LDLSQALESYTESSKGLEMEIDFIDRSAKMTFLTAVLMCLIVSFGFSATDGFGTLAAGIWGGINLLLIKQVVQSCFSPTKSYLKLCLLLAVKFPVLYYFGYKLLAMETFAAWNIIFGSSLVMAVTLTLGLKTSFSMKTTAAVFALAATCPLLASSDLNVPELPNLFTVLHSFFEDSKAVAWLVEWDSVLFSFIVAGAISLVFQIGAKNPQLIPGPLQNALEWVVESAKSAVTEVLGKEGEKFVPLLGTLFIYILVMNWMVLIPLMKPPSSSFNITIALAIVVFVLVQYQNMKNYGFFGFIYHMAGSPKDALGWALVPLILPIELLTQFTRPVTLALRLFGNVFGEDILIAAFSLFGVALIAHYNMPIGLPLQLPFMFLAVLTGLMQALVFTLLSTIYILLSMPGHDEH